VVLEAGRALAFCRRVRVAEAGNLVAEVEVLYTETSWLRAAQSWWQGWSGRAWSGALPALATLLLCGVGLMLSRDADREGPTIAPRAAASPAHPSSRPPSAAESAPLATPQPLASGPPGPGSAPTEPPPDEARGLDATGTRTSLVAAKRVWVNLAGAPRDVDELRSALSEALRTSIGWEAVGSAAEADVALALELSRDARGALHVRDARVLDTQGGELWRAPGAGPGGTYTGSAARVAGAIAADLVAQRQHGQGHR
jgi:hypothetical protein